MVEGFGWLIMGLAWGAALTLILFLSLEAHFRHERRKKRKAQEKEKQDRILLLDRDFDVKECIEHHLPGDCPLCGAE